MNASGAFSIPSTTVSRYLIRPSLSQVPTSRTKSGIRWPWSETMKPRSVSRLPTIWALLRGPPRAWGDVGGPGRRRGPVVLRDRAAHRPPAVALQRAGRGLEVLAADVVQVD